LNGYFTFLQSMVDHLQPLIDSFTFYNQWWMIYKHWLVILLFAMVGHLIHWWVF